MRQLRRIARKSLKVIRKGLQVSIYITELQYLKQLSDDTGLE
jgi:hypothetical protein